MLINLFIGKGAEVLRALLLFFFKRFATLLSFNHDPPFILRINNFKLNVIRKL